MVVERGGWVRRGLMWCCIWGWVGCWLVKEGEVLAGGDPMLHLSLQERACARKGGLYHFWMSDELLRNAVGKGTARKLKGHGCGDLWCWV